MAIPGYPYIQKEFISKYADKVKAAEKDLELLAEQEKTKPGFSAPTRKAAQQKIIEYYSKGGKGYNEEYADWIRNESIETARKLGITASQLMTNPVLATDAKALADYTGIDLNLAQQRVASVPKVEGVTPAPAPTPENPTPYLGETAKVSTGGMIKYQSPEGNVFEVPVGSESEANMIRAGYTKAEVDQDPTKYQQVNLSEPYPLVKFSDDPNGPAEGDETTVWLYDNYNKIYYPFLSMDGMKSVFGDNLDAALNKIQIMPSTVLNLPEWQGELKSNISGIKNDGTVSGIGNIGKYLTSIAPAGSIPGDEQTSGKIDTSRFLPEPGGVYDPETSRHYTTEELGAINNQVSTASLQNIYGQTKKPENESEISNTVGFILMSLQRKGFISQATFDKYSKDPALLAKYTNALLYGGYSPTDIMKDIKAKELTDSGLDQYANFKAFDESVSADQWKNTEEGRKANMDSSLNPPAELGIDFSIFDMPIFDIPASAFESLVDPIDWTSPEFKAEAEKIQAAWYDIQMQKNEAETDQARALAESNWQLFQSQLEKNYGLKLSNNAREAWNQLQTMFSGYSARGIGQSGLLQESVDRYLGDVRQTDELLRESKLEESELEERNYLLKYGTPEEIKAFVDSNPEKAKLYGLIPSEETGQFFNMDNLRKIYPDMTEKELQAVHDMMLDESGYYRSDLYQTLYGNKYGLTEEKMTYQQQKLLEQKQLEEEEAYAPYTKGKPFEKMKPGEEVTYEELPMGTKAGAEEQKAATNAPADILSGVQEAAKEQAERYQILNLEAMGKYKPEQYERLSTGEVVLKSGTTPIAGTYKTYAGTMPKIEVPSSLTSGGTTGQTGGQAPTTDKFWEDFKKKYSTKDWGGYAPIKAPSEAYKYENIQNPGGSTLYGKLKTNYL